MIQSPLNYTGGKYKLLPQILPLFPDRMDTFVDLFCGGCNVGINVKANKHLYNDNCTPLINLYKVMQKMETEEFIQHVEQVISKYGLSDVKRKGYDYYSCNSKDGLSAYNRESYLALRRHVNSITVRDDEYYIKLYVLIIYAFNNQIRFNRKGEYNLPPGKRDFNQKMHDKLGGFLEILHRQSAVFSDMDFREMDLHSLTARDFVYADPPYLITCASYNEQGGWNEEKEEALLQILDNLSANNVRLALSNVIEAKGKVNEILNRWVCSRPKYRMLELAYTYKNANYQRKNKEIQTREVLIVNY